MVDEYGNHIDDLEGMFNDEVALFTVRQVERYIFYIKKLSFIEKH